MGTWHFFLAITEDAATPCSMVEAIADWVVTAKAATAKAR